MIQTTTLLPGVTLRCFPDSRFKQGCLSLQLVRPMCREEAAMNALLPAVLLRGCRSCPDLRGITLRLDDLYGASVGTLVRRIGDYQTTGLYCGFIDDRYALEGDRVLDPMIDFLKELLLEPVLENGGFSVDFVESEKRNLISTIDAQRNDKRAYASDRLMRGMGSADSFGIPRLGTREAVAAIDAAGLYQHYQTILAQSRVELFYVGSADGQALRRRLTALFDGVDRDYQPLPPQGPFRDGGCIDQVETMEVAQGKLAMGYLTPITLRDPRFAAMQVCNTILGAGMTSKLFMQIREKMSLCYDISSGYHGSKGIVAVCAGIDSDKDALVRREVQRQVDACAEGQITEEELVAAKEALLSSLRTTHDSPGAIEGYYATAAISGMGMTPEAYMQAVSSVTVKQVAQAAKTLGLHSVYFLKGVR